MKWRQGFEEHEVLRGPTPTRVVMGPHSSMPLYPPSPPAPPPLPPAVMLTFLSSEKGTQPGGGRGGCVGVDAGLSDFTDEETSREREWRAQGRWAGGDKIPPALSPITHPPGPAAASLSVSRKIHTEKEGPGAELPAELPQHPALACGGFRHDSFTSIPSLALRGSFL